MSFTTRAQYYSCDINCCCDADCTNHDLKTFTMCSDQVKSDAIKHESILFDSSLFYVVIDNVPSDYFYPERDVSTAITCIVIYSIYIFIIPKKYRNFRHVHAYRLLCSWFIICN
jgi:hypothetical protein